MRVSRSNLLVLFALTALIVWIVRVSGISELGRQAAAMTVQIPHDRALELVSRFGGEEILAIAVDGDYAYGALNQRGLANKMLIWDVSDPNLIALIGESSELPYTINDINVRGNFAYVAALEAGLHIFDVSSPAHPVEVNLVNTPGELQRVTMVGDLALLADGSEGIRILDLQNPGNPVELNSLDTPGFVHDIAVRDSHAFIAEGFQSLLYPGAMRVVDFSDPINLVDEGAFFTRRPMVRIRIDGPFAYALSYETVFGVPYLQKVNILDPAMPVEERIIVWGYVHGVRDIAVGGGYIFATGPMANSLVVLNNSDLSLAAAQDYPGYPTRLFLAGDTLYLSGYYEGVRRFDVSNPRQPVQTSVFSPLPPFTQLLYNKGYLYGVVRDYGMVVLDISEPVKPRQVGFSPQPAIEKGTVEGRYAYLSLGQRLQIVDVGTPSSPADVFDLDSGLTQIEDLLVSNGFLYAAGNGLSIVDVSDPINSFVTGHLDLPFQVNAIAKKGERVYLTTTTSNVPEPFVIVDVSDSGNPHVMATAAVSGVDVALFGEFAYLAAGDAGLRLVNISDPSLPVEWPGINTPGYAHNLAIWDHYLFAATGEAGAVVFDINDQSNPFFLGSFQAPNISNATVVSDTVYLVDATVRPPSDRSVELAGSGVVYQVNRSVSTIRISPGAGGVIQHTNSQNITTTLSIPSAAVNYTTTLLLANAEDALWPIGRAIVGQAVDLLAYRDNVLFPDLIFDTPLTLTMEYLDTKLGVVSDVSGIGIEWNVGGVWADPATTCQQQPGVPLKAASRVAAATFCQTGQFALIGPTNSLIFPFVPLQTQSNKRPASYRHSGLQ